MHVFCITVDIAVISENAESARVVVRDAAGITLTNDQWSLVQTAGEKAHVR